MSEQRSGKWIMHLDMDAFFASVEQRDHPEYRGRPVIVGALPGSRGVVATCSYEARQFGVRSAMPISEAHRRCPQAIYVRPGMGRYADVSKQVMTLLSDISPVVEPVSIDEAYIDITGLEKLFGTVEKIAAMTKQRIFEQTQLNCSIGVGPNRLIAKLASEFDKPNGLKIVSPEQVQAFLDPLPVADLRGVGRQTVKSINRLGIFTVHDLRRCSQELLQQQFGERGAQHLYNQARGIASDLVGQVSERKSISKEHTFGQDVSDQQLIRDWFRRLSSEVGRSTRKKELAGHVISIKVRFSNFETHTRQQRLRTPLDTDSTIFQHALALFEKSGFANRAVRLIGVGLSVWEAEEPLMGDLFESEVESQRDKKLYSALDEISDKFGDGTVTLGLPKR
ncbi:MAG: DNA polymerase IV [Chromatiales bacterium]|nr:DNA polymerase IV [Chromatiales bacterium]